MTTQGGLLGWTKVDQGAVIAPDQRLSWPRTVSIGLQHIVAMFGATFLVPVLTGFSPATTLFFSGIGTLLFLIITRNRMPSYLGSSFAIIAPVLAARPRRTVRRRRSADSSWRVRCSRSSV